MLAKLPHSQFRWMSSEELAKFNVDTFEAMGDYGVVLEVRLDNSK